ncbi:GPI transamidase subunit PIG-U [Cynara cardunculus var. scolymus]|uniref:GPI transamidase subunit PIG-U n=1 Tax=Cynara cardunculus var. scolymus TaxID=59895 RepID=A0A124SBW1_CYNCS|nr:GPI transamidase subunit PIG-U [Cynara cardunculus var. scolymus]
MEKSTKKQPWFWTSAVASIITRLVLIIYFPNTLNFSSRPEISTPLTSIRRLAEGYWLKQSSMSPYAGSMYHGSPLLLSILGPLTIDRGEGQRSHLLFSLAFVVADFITAMLIRSIGQLLQIADSQSLKSLGAGRLLKVSGLVPLAAFGWVIASHLSLYPAILVIPLVLLIGSGLDTPPRKLFVQNKYGDDQNELSSDTHRKHKGTTNGTSNLIVFSWRRVVLFFFWASVWAFYVLVLCSISLKEFSGLGEMFKRTYGFILSVEDLSPNIGLLWYFFAEVFDFFRDFFLIVFHINILFMVLPLAIRLHHRPCFLAFVYIAISSVLKSYPSVNMQFSFFLFSGYLGTLLLSPVMHNLWIWRIILVVESVSSMLSHDRALKQATTPVSKKVL